MPTSTHGAASERSPSAWRRQDFDLQLTKYAERGWRANFYPSGLAHSIVKGTAFEETPWRAVQRAAWEALSH